MIQKLRRQFVAVCMALVALVMAAVCGAAYHAVRQNIEDLSRQMLQQVISEDSGRGKTNPGVTIEIGGDQLLLPYFTVNIWGDTAYITGGTYADLEDTDALRDILSQCLAQGTTEGTISDYHLRYLVRDNGLYRKLAFVDMSMEQAMLARMIRSYLVIALAAMLVLLAIRPALQEAVLLSEICARVTVVQNLPFLTGEQRLVQTLAARENVEYRYGTVVTGYEGAEALTALRLLQTETGEESRLEVDGAFLAIGTEPENAPFVAVAALNEQGYIAAGEACTTAAAGIFAAGDCRAKAYRQVSTAISDCAAAALNACRWLDSQAR